MEAKAHHSETVLAAFHLNNKEAKREQKVNFKNETLPFCSKPKYLKVNLVRSLMYHQHLESLHKKVTSHVTLLSRLAGSGRGAGATTLLTVNSHPSAGAFNCRVLCSCLVLQTATLLAGLSTLPLTPWRLGGFGDFCKKTAVFGCLTNALAPPPIALESCSTAQTDRPV